MKSFGKSYQHQRSGFLLAEREGILQPLARLCVVNQRNEALFDYKRREHDVFPIHRGKYIVTLKHRCLTIFRILAGLNLSCDVFKEESSPCEERD